jgi:hypothetical protein
MHSRLSAGGFKACSEATQWAAAGQGEWGHVHPQHAGRPGCGQVQSAGLALQAAPIVTCVCRFVKGEVTR